METPCAGKLARTVWSGGKVRDDIKDLPITIAVFRQHHRRRELCRKEIRHLPHPPGGRQQCDTFPTEKVGHKAESEVRQTLCRTDIPSGGMMG